MAAELPYAETPVGDVPGIVAAARATFRSGRTRTLEWRMGQVDALIKMVSDNKDAITEALRKDLRRPVMECVVAESMGTIAEARHLKANLEAYMEVESVATPLTQKPASSELRREPLGVVLVIAPWNFPINLCLMPLMYVLAAGNTAVIKPSEVSPHSAALLGEMLPKYLDPDAVKVVQGGVPQTSAVLEQRFDHIIYTGGGSVGKIVMTAAARHLTPVTLELGGKSPVVVDKSANLDVAAKRILAGKLLNAGQVCIAPDYILVDKTREADLVDALKRTLGKFYKGGSIKESPDLGRIINGRHVARLKSLLDSHTGDIAFGGEIDESDRFVEPTILTNPSPDSKIMQEEIFGPLLPVMSVNNVDDAIAYINERPKPLALYVFSEDGEATEKVLTSTSSGGVGVNETIMHIVNPHLPFGGVGDSGMGAYHGKAGFDLFSHVKSVLHKPTWMDPAVRYPPYNDSKQRMVTLVLNGMPDIPGGKKGILVLLIALGLAYSRFSRGSKL